MHLLGRLDANLGDVTLECLPMRLPVEVTDRTTDEDERAQYDET
jgi:hypothetical protein